MYQTCRDHLSRIYSSSIGHQSRVCLMYKEPMPNISRSSTENRSCFYQASIEDRLNMYRTIVGHPSNIHGWSIGHPSRISVIHSKDLSYICRPFLERLPRMDRVSLRDGMAVLPKHLHIRWHRHESFSDKSWKKIRKIMDSLEVEQILKKYVLVLPLFLEGSRGARVRTYVSISTERKAERAGAVGRG